MSEFLKKRNYPNLTWWKSSLLCLLSAGLLIFSVPKWNLFFLAWIWACPISLVIVSPKTKLRGAFLYGWLTGLAIHAGGFYWLQETVERFGNLTPLISWGIFFFFVIASGLSYGIFSILVKILLKTPLPFPLSMGFSIVLIESFFPHLFPWNIGMSHWAFPLSIQSAEIWGCSGISAIIMIFNGIIFEKIAGDAGWLERTKKMEITAKVAAMTFILLLLGGALRMENLGSNEKSMPSLKVGIVQPNISIEKKKDPSWGLRNLWLLQSLSSNLQQRGVRLIVWPETSYPFIISRDSKTDFENSRKRLGHLEVAVLFGALSHGEGKIYNSAFITTPDGKLIGPSDKNNLVLFGEYNPLHDLLPESIKIRYPEIARRGLSPGSNPVPLEYEGIKIGVLNCFEDILSNYTTKVVKAGGDFLVNITNDAWFGDTAEPWQHFALSVFRTIENRRYLVRSVNTGVSGVINLLGKTIYRSNTFEQEFEIIGIRLSKAKTLFTIIGDWLKWFSLFIVFITILINLIQRKNL